MNYNQATQSQLHQIATDEDCSMDDKYKTARQLQIKFKLSLKRKQGMENNFNPGLSDYWEDAYQSIFKGW
jgi:hypothetical protein